MSKEEIKLKELEAHKELIHSETLIFLKRNPNSTENQIINYLKTKIGFDPDSSDIDDLFKLLLDNKNITNHFLFVNN